MCFSCPPWVEAVYGLWGQFKSYFCHSVSGCIGEGTCFPMFQFPHLENGESNSVTSCDCEDSNEIMPSFILAFFLTWCDHREVVANGVNRTHLIVLSTLASARSPEKPELGPPTGKNCVLKPFLLFLTLSTLCILPLS